MAGEGKKLTQCLNVVSAYGKEVEALCETLNDLLTQEIGKSDLPCKLVGKMEQDYRTDEMGWIYTDITWSLPLAGQRTRNGKPEMFLSYQISLIGDGMSFPGNEDPLLHVCLWESDVDFNDEGYYMGYPLEQEPPFCLKDNRLIVWGGQGNDWKSNSWTFSIRLLTLDSSQALLDRVIKPAIALLKGSAVTAALPEDLPGLVLYPDESMLNIAAEENTGIE